MSKSAKVAEGLLGALDKYSYRTLTTSEQNLPSDVVPFLLVENVFAASVETTKAHLLIATL